MDSKTEVQIPSEIGDNRAPLAGALNSSGVEVQRRKLSPVSEIIGKKRAERMIEITDKQQEIDLCIDALAFTQQWLRENECDEPAYIGLFGIISRVHSLMTRLLEIGPSISEDCVSALSGCSLSSLVNLIGDATPDEVLYRRGFELYLQRKTKKPDLPAPVCV